MSPIDRAAFANPSVTSTSDDLAESLQRVSEPQPSHAPPPWSISASYDTLRPQLGAQSGTGPAVPTSGSGSSPTTQPAWWDAIAGSSSPEPPWVADRPIFVGQIQPTKFIPALEIAQNDYRIAHAEVGKLESQLDQQLAEIGPALTDTQRTAYLAAFHEKHREVYQAEADAATALKNAINDPRTDRAAAQYPECAAEVASAVKALASSSQGQAALDWLADHFGSDTAGASGPDNVYGAYFSSPDIGAVAETAAQSAAAAALADDDPESCIAQTLDSLQRLANVGVGGSSLKASVDLYKSLQAGLRGNGHSLKAAFADAYRKGVGAGFEAAGFVLAGALVAKGLIAGVGDSTAERAKFLGDLSIALQGGAQKAGELLKSGKNAFWEKASAILKNSTATPGAVGDLLARSAPILGGLAGAFYTIADAAALIDDPTWWKAGSVAGDVLSLGLLIPGGQAVALIGIGIVAICQILGTLFDDGERHGEERGLLASIGVDRTAAEVLVGNPDGLAAVASTGAFSPEEIQTLAQAHPAIFATPSSASAFADIVKASGLRGADAVGIADALANEKNGEDTFANLGQYVDVLKSADALLTGSEILVALQNRGYDKTLAYLTEKAPDAVSEARARQEADASYDLLGSLGGPSGKNFAYVLGMKDDSLYRSQLIADAADQFALPSFVDQIATSGEPKDKELLARAIGEAVRDGKLDKASADVYAAKLGYGPVVIGTAY